MDRLPPPRAYVDVIIRSIVARAADRANADPPRPTRHIAAALPALLGGCNGREVQGSPVSRGSRQGRASGQLLEYQLTHPVGVGLGDLRCAFIEQNAEANENGKV